MFGLSWITTKRSFNCQQSMKKITDMNLSKLTLMMVVMSLCLQISVTTSSRNIQQHVLDQMNMGEDLAGSSTKRIYEIYSKATGRRVQILGKKVNANGRSGNRFAKLEISSISFGGRITIRGIETGRYLCMNRKGRLIGKLRRVNNNRCKFTERIDENYFDTFTNVHNPRWYLAFQQSGRPKRGPKTSRGRVEVMFLKRPIHTTAPVTTSSPSTVDKQTWTDIEKRIRMNIMSSRRYMLGRQEEARGTTMMMDSPFADEVALGRSPTSEPAEIEREIYIRKLLQKYKNEYTNTPTPYPATVSATLETWPESLLRETESRKSTGKKRRQKNRRKEKKRSRVAEVTPRIIDSDFNIRSSNDKSSRRKTPVRLFPTTSPYPHQGRLEATSTIPSMLQLNRTNPTRRNRIKSNRSRTKSNSRSRKSRKRVSSRRRNKTKDIT